MVWTVDADDLIDQFLEDERVDVLITNRPGYAVRRRAALQAATVARPVRWRGSSATPGCDTRES
jgi:hypothetical protein